MRTPTLLLLPLLLLAAAACRAQDAPATAARPRRDSVAVTSADPLVRDAQAALAAGRPHRASRVLAPALADSTRRTPEIVLVAAVAAAGWEGWGEVRRLLEDAGWVDSLAEGRGRLLLTRAALAQRDAGAAVRHATAAVRDIRDERQRGERLVLLARALDQLEARDSAAATYERAAALVPGVRDWLLLRAAGVEVDAARRQALYARVGTPVARSRIARTELAVLERSNEDLGAARLADSLGEPSRALRLRLGAATTPADRASLRAALLAIVRTRAGTDDARTAVEVLDASFPPATAAEELLVARSATRAGPLARAARGYERALRASIATSTDRLRYGEVLIRLDRDREAALQLARLTAPASVAAAAAYQRGRAILRAQGRPQARTALQLVRRRYPTDTSAANALLLLADLATDEGRDTDARDAFLLVVREHAAARVAPLAAFRGAILALALREPRTAATELDAALARWPGNVESNAMRYWAGRAWAAAGDSARARERWRATTTAEPSSYYAAVAAARLGEKAWAPPAGGRGADDTVVAAHVARATVLERVGMDLEARLEYDALARLADDPGPRALAAADALVRLEQPSRAIGMGWRLIEGGIRDDRAYRAAYPVLERELIGEEAARHGLDPALVAALVRQESSFNPRATSPVGARGLMQVMPGVGAALARARTIAPWDPVLLYQPDVNVVLGTMHLAEFLRQYPHVAYALAAYNAGPSRVTAWRRKAGTDDPELFIERIPFVETRDYVRIVLRNRELYRALYAW